MEFTDVEKAREKYHAKLVRGWSVAGIIVGVVALALFFPGLFSDGSLPVLMFSIVFIVFTLAVAGCVILGTTGREATEYQKAYKGYFIEKSLARIFKVRSYSHTGRLEPRLLSETGMISTGDEYSSNDLVEAEYKGVEFMQADVAIAREYTDSDGDTHTATIFKGQWMIYEFPKQFNFRLMVAGKHFGSSLVVRNARNGRKFKKMETESAEFNKHFKIYAEDGFETFYLLDPAIIEQIIDMGRVYQFKLALLFSENKLYVGLNNGKDIFEPPKSSEPIDEVTETARVEAQIRTITDFVDKLKLDRKIFKN